jgi:hypothetical protein
MPIHLDHVLVPARDRVAAARQLGELLDVPWAASGGAGPFSPAYVDEGLTIDFDEVTEPFAPLHFAFRVDDATFDAILGRIQAAGLAWRSSPIGPVDHRIGTFGGGRVVYWSEPDGHAWEILTVSYARQG